MIGTLSKLKLLDFIELVAVGNVEVLRESPQEEYNDLKKMAGELIYSYQSIVNPSGQKIILMDKEDNLKVQYKLTLCKILKIMIGIGVHNEVVNVLEGLGYHVEELSDAEKRIDRIKAEAEYLQHRLKGGTEQTMKTSDEVHAAFDKEIAFLMTYFKMNIDVNMISAGVYANMLHQADVELKRKISRR